MIHEPLDTAADQNVGFRRLVSAGARDGELPVSSRKAFALLTYLSLSPGMLASRDKLADLLWSDRGPEQARGSLRQTLTVLRRELGSGHCDLVQARRDVVALEPSLLRTDAQSFLAALAARTPDRLREAADLYTGPFLDGFFAGASEFEDWAASERDRFLSLAVETLDELARLAGSDGGLAYAKRLLTLDPAREATYRLLMEVHAAAGNRDKALQLYEACRDMMRRVYGVDPSAETVATRVRIATVTGAVMSRANASVPAPSGSVAPAEKMPTVRVLNFVNLTGAADPDGFARGLADEIITALLRQRGVVVLSERPTASSEALHGGKTAANGEARYILSGSVQTAANRIRVNAQLIDLVLGTHVWAERYDGGAEGALDLQDRVAQSIALAARHELPMACWNLHDRARRTNRRCGSWFGARWSSITSSRKSRSPPRSALPSRRCSSTRTARAPCGPSRCASRRVSRRARYARRKRRRRRLCGWRNGP
jgi:DNA-binding SARP family transcriptional activator